MSSRKSCYAQEMRARIGALLLLLELPLSRGATTAPTFAHNIAPILYTNCAPCHYTGGPGPFPLTSFADVRKHARQIATVTRSRYMPPWLPAHGSGDFLDELRLTATQIRTIAEWVNDGSPEGLASETPAPPRVVDGWPLGPPDLILKAPQSLRVPAGGADLYWNFVLTPPLATRRFIRAVDIRPSNPKIIHHANLIVDPTGTQRTGFPGMDVTVLRGPLDLDGHFLFWKPGALPYSEPAGLAWPLDPGSRLILNTHLQPSGKPEVEQPTIALYFTDQPPTRFPYLLQLEHDGNLDIPADARDFVISDQFRLPIDTQLLAIYPHAHYLGHLLEAWADLPNGVRQSLIRIPDWDPNWQAVYRYRQPLHLPAGTLISMRYHYDNSAANPRNPNAPPRRVQGGNLATDEMGHLWLELLPEHARDGRRVYAEAWARHQLEKYPDDFQANLTLGSLALARLNPQEAVSPLNKAVRFAPHDAIALNLYGAALEGTGRMAEALTQFRLAVQHKPAYANARFNLAHALARSGDLPDAVADLRQILATNPSDPAAQAYLDHLTGKPGAK